MSAAPCWDHWLHRKYFSEQSYYCYTSLFHTQHLLDLFHGVRLFSNFIPAQWRHITVDMFFLSFLFVSSSWMSATTSWNKWLHRKYFAKWSYYCYIINYFLIQGKQIFIWLYNYYVQELYWINCEVSPYLVISFHRNGSIWPLSLFLCTLHWHYSVLFPQHHGKITLLLYSLLLMSKIEQTFGKWYNYTVLINETMKWKTLFSLMTLSH